MSDPLDARNFIFLIRRRGSTRSVTQNRFLTPFQLAKLHSGKYSFAKIWGLILMD